MGNCFTPGVKREAGDGPSTAVFHERYKQERKQLGEGRAGHVFKCTERSSNKVYACKNISKKDQSVIECRREVQILNRLQGAKYIIQLKEVYEDHRNLFLVTELCSGGELYDQIVTRSETEEGRFSEAETAVMMKQILGAVHACHSLHQITHRDLKPENFLLKHKDDLSQIRLIDFGLSRFYQSDERLRTRVGTVYYTAPEVWSENYDCSCDLWSAGVMMYVLLCSYPPFDGDSDKDILRTVCRGKYSFPRDEWDAVSNEAKNLIRKLLTKNPRRRPSAAEALEDPWFKQCLGGTSEEEDNEDEEDDVDLIDGGVSPPHGGQLKGVRNVTTQDAVSPEKGLNDVMRNTTSSFAQQASSSSSFGDGGGEDSASSAAAKAEADARKASEAKARAVRAKAAAAAARQRQDEALQAKKKKQQQQEHASVVPPSSSLSKLPPPARSPRNASNNKAAAAPVTPPGGAEDEDDDEGWAPMTELANSVTGSVSSVGAAMGLYQ